MGEGPLDEVAFSVEHVVVGDRALPVRVRRNDRIAVLLKQHFAKGVRVKAAIGDDTAPSNAFDERQRADAFVPLSLGEFEVDRKTFAVDDQMDLGRRTAARAADRITRGPPFPPAEC